MPVRFDAYADNPDFEWALSPDSNAYRILTFLAAQPDAGFTPAEIGDATGIPRGMLGRG